MNCDPRELAELSRRRRASFATQLNPGNDSYIQAVLVQAIRHTDLCMKVVTDLTVTLSEYTKKVRVVFEQDTLRSTQIVDITIDSLEPISSISDEQLRSQVIQFVRQSADLQFESGWTILKLTEEVYQLVDSTADRLLYSLRDILGSCDEEEALKALGLLLEFLIGVIPILGTLAGGYSAIRDLVDKQKEAREATAYLTTIKDYATASFYWAASAQIFINGIAGVKADSEDAQLNSVVEKLTKQLEEFAA